MNPCLIKLDDMKLYSGLSADMTRELLADIVTRYEGLFMVLEPVYLEGKPELLFQVLQHGYGLIECNSGIHLEVIDLRTEQVEPNKSPVEKWKDIFAGRVMAQAFARTLTTDRSI